jgi:hypothetical protein
LYFNNTDYNENITFVGNSTIYINDTSIKYLNIVGDEFRFEITQTPYLPGFYFVNITFVTQYEKTDSIIVIFEVIADTIMESSSLASDTVNASLMSGNTLDFWIVWESEYGAPIVDIDVISNDSSVKHKGFELSNGTHYFNFTAGSIGFVNIKLSFNLTSFYDLILVLRFEVTDRALVIDSNLTSYADFTTIVGLEFADWFYFSVFLNDSMDSSPVSTSISLLPENVSLVGTIGGNHTFVYKAWFIGNTGPLTILFTKANYQDIPYHLTFVVDVAQSEILLAPSSVNIYYTKDTNFSIIWQKVPNANAPLTPTIRINTTSVSTPSIVVFQGLINGNYTFGTQAVQPGTFPISIVFYNSSFTNQSVDITIIVLPVPTKFENVTFSNQTIIGLSGSEFYFSDSTDFEIEWRETFNDSGIQDTTPVFQGNGSSFTSLTNSTIDGNHTFSFQGEALGMYMVTITFGTQIFANLRYIIYFNVSLMPTSSLNESNMTLPESIYVEEFFTIAGSGYQSFRNVSITEITDFTVSLNGTEVGQILILNNSNAFEIQISTVGFSYGFYNISLQLNSTGYEPQTIYLNIELLGRDILVEISLPVSTIRQGENITIDVTLEYESINAGFGSTIFLTPWNEFSVHYYIEMDLTNGSTLVLETDLVPNALGQSSFLIPGSVTKSATGFSNITVSISGSSTSLPTSFSMSQEELDLISISEFLDPFDILIPAFIILVILSLLVSSVYYVNRRRKARIEVKRFAELTIERGFEDIKSIRLIIARHQSGLQFYSEKTIAELQTDTDALSGMSAAMSSFMEELSESMTAQSEEEPERDKIELMSREGLHMQIWHGNYSSLIIISEIQLPDYFQTRLKLLGNELEGKFKNELQDFYSSDQIPSTVVKKMVRKYVPLHYFCAFVLNEGVLTLESIKFSRKEKKMLDEMKKVMFTIEGANYFFSEQIISHLSKRYKRSEAIKFLDYAIEINLLIEADQKDLLSLTKL